jgi:Ca-activated chloride channel homolog
MHRRNSAGLLIFLLTTLLFAYSQTGAAPSSAQGPAAATSPTSPSPVPSSAPPNQTSPTAQNQSQTAPAEQLPNSAGSPAGATGATQAPDSQAPASSQAPPPDAGGQNGAPPPADQGQQGGQNPDSGDNGVFVFKKQVEEVILHATVVDNKQHIVTDLDKSNFNVLEGGRPQAITSFRHEDIPVAMCIVVDNSGSMREKREKVNAAALNLVRASNPNDEVCVVNFNDEYYLDQDFTSNINKLKQGLEKIETRGGTALYDAVVASAVHLKENAKLEKKVIFVVTDGVDNESSETLEQAVRRLQTENGPTVYAIGILEGEENTRHARRALQVMCERTGGIAFLPKTLDEVDAISRSVAHDIRSQYTIGYKPTTPRSVGGYREVKVDAHSQKYKQLMVRTKSGYYAGDAPTGGH